jgi:hypothetical protein
MLVKIQVACKSYLYTNGVVIVFSYTQSGVVSRALVESLIKAYVTILELKTGSGFI